MGRFNESFEDRRERERQERREYEGDAYYEAYRQGIHPDRVTYERVDEAYYAGRSPESVAGDIRRLDEQRRCEREQEEISRSEEEYYREQELLDYERGN